MILKLCQGIWDRDIEDWPLHTAQLRTKEQSIRVIVGMTPGLLHV